MAGVHVAPVVSLLLLLLPTKSNFPVWPDLFSMSHKSARQQTDAVVESPSVKMRRVAGGVPPELLELALLLLLDATLVELALLDATLVELALLEATSVVVTAFVLALLEAAPPKPVLEELAPPVPDPVEVVVVLVEPEAVDPLGPVALVVEGASRPRRGNCARGLLATSCGRCSPAARACPLGGAAPPAPWIEAIAGVLAAGAECADDGGGRNLEGTAT